MNGEAGPKAGPDPLHAQHTPGQYPPQSPSIPAHPHVCSRCGRIGGAEVVGARIDAVARPTDEAPVQLEDHTGRPYFVMAPQRFVLAYACRSAAGCRP